jgi:hypothetical protein
LPDGPQGIPCAGTSRSCTCPRPCRPHTWCRWRGTGPGCNSRRCYRCWPRSRPGRAAAVAGRAARRRPRRHPCRRECRRAPPLPPSCRRRLRVAAVAAALVAADVAAAAAEAAPIVAAAAAGSTRADRGVVSVDRGAVFPPHPATSDTSARRQRNVPLHRKSLLGRACGEGGSSREQVVHAG